MGIMKDKQKKGSDMEAGNVKNSDQAIKKLKAIFP